MRLRPGRKTPPPRRAADDKATLKIPRALYRRLAGIVTGTGFASVTEFAVYVLRDVASIPAGRKKSPPRPAAARTTPATAVRGHSLTSGEVDLVRQRLKALGYL